MERSDRWAIPVLQGLVVVGLAVRLLEAWNLAPGFDELQVLHAAWSVSKGLLPYRDFWENHTPLTLYLLAPLPALGLEGASLLYAARGVMAVLGVVVLALLYQLGRLVLRRRGAWMALALLGACALFQRHVVEVSPDLPYLVLFLGSLVVLLRAPGRGGQALGAGLLLGLGFLATPKALVALAGTMLGLLAAGRGRGRAFGMAALFGLGFLAPIAGLAAAFTAAGALGALWRWTVVFNLSVPSGGGPLAGADGLMRWHFLPFVVLGGTGLLFAAAGGVRDRDGRWPVLAVLAAVLVVAFALLLPRPFQHCVPPFCPLLVLGAAWAIEATRARAVFLGLLAAATFVPVARACVADPDLAATLAIEEKVRALAGPEGAVFSRDAVAMTRPSAQFFHVIVDEVGQAWSERRYPPPDLPALRDALVAARCRVVVLDWALDQTLPPEEIAWIEARYVDLGDGSGGARRVLVPGVRLAGPSERRFEAVVTGRYRVEGPGAAGLRVDGRPAGAAVDLEAGPHALAGGAAGLTLRLAAL